MRLLSRVKAPKLTIGFDLQSKTFKESINAGKATIRYLPREKI